jgi:hypothetical protein
VPIGRLVVDDTCMLMLCMTPADSPNTGIEYKTENKSQYQEYLTELEPIREELGIPLKEVLYPKEK